MYASLERKSARQWRMSHIRGWMAPARPAIDRGSLALAGRFDADAAFPAQTLEEPVEELAVRLVAERGADIAPREPLGQAGKGRQKIAAHLARGASPGAWRRRGLLGGS